MAPADEIGGRYCENCHVGKVVPDEVSITAVSEGVRSYALDVGIGGAVPVADRLKQLRQSMDTVDLFRPVTKFSAEIDSASSVSEVVANAFRAAESGRPGAAFISAPKDIMLGEANSEVLTPTTPVSLGPADRAAVAAAADMINKAKNSRADAWLACQ